MNRDPSSMKYLAYRGGGHFKLFQFTVITIKAAPNSMKHIAYRGGGHFLLWYFDN